MTDDGFSDFPDAAGITQKQNASAAKQGAARFSPADQRLLDDLTRALEWSSVRYEFYSVAREKPGTPAPQYQPGDLQHFADLAQNLPRRDQLTFEKTSRYSADDRQIFNRLSEFPGDDIRPPYRAGRLETVSHYTGSDRKQFDEYMRRYGFTDSEASPQDAVPAAEETLRLVRDMKIIDFDKQAESRRSTISQGRPPKIRFFD